MKEPDWAALPEQMPAGVRRVLRKCLQRDVKLRLRDIGGIIVIDFIDMRHARNRQKVMEAMADFVKNDRAKIKILPITRLGLIEMTRLRSFVNLMNRRVCRGIGQHRRAERHGHRQRRRGNSFLSRAKPLGLARRWSL